MVQWICSCIWEAEVLRPIIFKYLSSSTNHDFVLPLKYQLYQVLTTSSKIERKSVKMYKLLISKEELNGFLCGGIVPHTHN